MFDNAVRPEQWLDTIKQPGVPLGAAPKAALKATSVLPKPTSPQTSLSIGSFLSMSSRTSPEWLCPDRVFPHN